MIYLKLENNEITNIHYMPFDIKHGLNKTEKELLETGILVDELPEALEIENKVSNLRYDAKKKELYYEYTDIPKTEMEILLDENNQLKESLADLWEVVLMGGIN